jgi:predicted TIM-barrel fold metal-dependent hydrolase
LEQEIDAVADAGLIGLKLHAQHQGFVVDDRRLLPFYEKVASRGLVAIIHGGHDIGFPGNENSLPESIARLHRMVPSLVIIAAHFGGWRVWEQAAQHLLGLDIYLDTSLCDEIAPATRARILAGHSRERIVFGSDSPWQDQGDAVAAVLRLPIDADYKDRILGGNALRLCTQRR